MITKGVSDLRGVHSLNTRPGPITESSRLLKLYQIASEKENLLKKLARIRGQKEQTEKRLAEIARSMHAIEQAVEEKTRRQPASTSHTVHPDAFIKY